MIHGISVNTEEADDDELNYLSTKYGESDNDNYYEWNIISYRKLRIGYILEKIKNLKS